MIWENMQELIRFQEIQSPDTTFIDAHITSLLNGMSKYFNCPDSLIFDWLRNPFQSNATASFSFTEKQEFLDIKTNSGLRLEFGNCGDLDSFGIDVAKTHPLIGNKAIGLLLPFPTSYLCEDGFSAVATLKSKYSSKRDVEHEIRAAISKLKPRFDLLCEKHRAHCSH